MTTKFFGILILALSFFANVATAQCSDNQPKAIKASYHMGGDQDVVDIAISSKDHTTLVAAVQAAGLVETLKGDGPFTIFAPTNTAFKALPEGTVPTLLQPENKATLTSILTYHVVAGNLDSKAVVAAIKANNGKATVTTLQGGTLTAMIKDKNVVLVDEQGNEAVVTAVDLKGSNGVIHVIDKVVMPK